MLCFQPDHQLVVLSDKGVGKFGGTLNNWRKKKMLDKEELRPAATAAFAREINRLVNFLAGDCWDSNLPTYLKKVGEILQAGLQMQVFNLKQSATPLSEEEIAIIVDNLKPLRTLKMEVEAKAYIIKVLMVHGVCEEVFTPTPGAP